MAEQLTDFGIISPPTFNTNPELGAVRQRILGADRVEEADLQIKAETLAVLHSIRRILMWTLVTAPLVLLGAAILVILYFAS